MDLGGRGGRGGDGTRCRTTARVPDCGACGGGGDGGRQKGAISASPSTPRRQPAAAAVACVSRIATRNAIDFMQEPPRRHRAGNCGDPFYRRCLLDVELQERVPNGRTRSAESAVAATR